jgi:hypothetical protein
VSERPILFSAPMVRALLAGQKTQTRRVVKPQPLVTTASDGSWRDSKADLWRNARQYARDCSPYGAPGDRLWVRETWLPDPPIDGTWAGDVEWYGCGRSIAGVPEHYRKPENCIYAASWDGAPLAWRPSIHMPRWASRLTLEVTQVRLQPLQEISEDDARAEGAPVGEMLPGSVNGEPAKVMAMDARVAFAWLWDSINGKRAPMAGNPWVWAITFRKCA